MKNSLLPPLTAPPTLQGLHRIHIAKSSLKFSVAHSTVYPDGTKEALHGHNYMVHIGIDLMDITLAHIIPFAYFKDRLQQICDAWDEKVLLPATCPFFEIQIQNSVEIEYRLCKKHYVLPVEEIVLLPVDNISVENLAYEYCRQFIVKIDPDKLTHQIHSIQVRIEESPGQGATFIWSNLQINSVK